MADILYADDIGRPKRIGQAIQDKQLQAFGHPLAKYDALCPEFLFYTVEVFTNFPDGLIPGNRLPAACATVSDSFEWIFQTVRMRQPLMGYGTFDADIAFV